MNSLMRPFLPLGFMAGGVLLLALSSNEASAQATNLICNQCVQASDLDTGPVNSSRLANNAVNNSKIANGAVNAAKLAANAVNNAKLANSAITTGKMTTAAVTAAKVGPQAATTAKIANAAVTAAKIAGGAVTTAKLADGVVTTDKLQDGVVTAAKLGIANTIHIDDSGVAIDNCTALLDALDGLAGPAQVVLGPGDFDCGAAQVVVPSNVSLIGAGRGLTRILGDGGASITQSGVTNLDVGVVRFIGDGAALRHLSVHADAADNDAGGMEAGNIYAVRVREDSASVRDWSLIDVEINIVAPLEVFRAIALSAAASSGTDCDGGVLQGVMATATSTGNATAILIDCQNSKVTAHDLHAMATSGGSDQGTGIVVSGETNGAAMDVRNSRITTDDISVLMGGNGTNVKLVSTEFNRDPFGSSNTLICLGSYDDTGTAYSDGVFGSGGCQVLGPE